MDGLDPGSHSLNISGYRVESSTAEVESETWTRLDISLTVSGDALSRRVFDIVGRVTNRDSGNPVQAASVSATDVRSVTSTVIATTDEFGSYVISALPQGRYELTVDAGGYPTHAEQLDVTGDLGWEVFLRAIPSLVNGRVTRTDPNGARIPVGANVRAINLDMPDGSSAQSTRAVAVSRV
ncbi:MAG TPA: carboxypeptidase regulatory-like domain-containing protein, partial [Dehalococcoidia bacterium]|nr:carboxypeptidase regulatory-like domain-containing protein [Dehalococcoidia bacterium]